MWRQYERRTDDGNESSQVVPNEGDNVSQRIESELREPSPGLEIPSGSSIEVTEMSLLVTIK